MKIRLMRTIIFTSLWLFSISYAGTVFDIGLSLGPALADNKVATSSTKIPKAVFPEPIFDFQTAVEGNKITHDFLLENQGQAPLVIEKVQPD